MHNVGIIGKARSGKDTAANFLIRTRGYTRLAFADPLKEMALAVDPIVYPYEYVNAEYESDIRGLRLAQLVREYGWERAKDEYPEVRRLLQHMGQTVREYDDEFWIKAMRRKLNNAEAYNIPVVVTDVRYPNEADMLRARGFKLVRITRSATLHGSAATHSSETALDDYPADATVYNTAGIPDFEQRIAAEL